MKTPRQVNGFLKLFEVFEKAAETEKAREFRAVKKKVKVIRSVFRGTFERV